jgi:hypothetical protein
MIQTSDEIANEIRMRSLYDRGPFILVEGSSDAIFFSYHMTANIENIIPTFGWERMFDVIVSLPTELQDKTIGLIDLDYRDIVRTRPKPANVFTTDSHDLETMMFSSNAFQKVLIHKSSKQKVKAYPSGSRGVKKAIIKLAKFIGYVRFYSQYKGKHYSFDEMHIEKFIRRNDLCFSESKFTSHLRSNNPQNSSIPNKILKPCIVECNKVAILNNPYMLCCGHDLMEIMAIGLKSMWGSFSAREISGKLLEDSFMLAYTCGMFSQTNLFRQISDWFNDRGYCEPWKS